MLKASNSSRSIKKTSNNKKNVVATHRGFSGGGGGVKISLTNYARNEVRE